MHTPAVRAEKHLSTVRWSKGCTTTRWAVRRASTAPAPPPNPTYLAVAALYAFTYT